MEGSAARQAWREAGDEEAELRRAQHGAGMTWRRRIFVECGRLGGDGGGGGGGEHLTRHVGRHRNRRGLGASHS